MHLRCKKFRIILSRPISELLMQIIYQLYWSNSIYIDMVARWKLISDLRSTVFTSCRNSNIISKGRRGERERERRINFNLPSKFKWSFLLFKKHFNNSSNKLLWIWSLALKIKFVVVKNNFQNFSTRKIILKKRSTFRVLHKTFFPVWAKN